MMRIGHPGDVDSVSPDGSGLKHTVLDCLDGPEIISTGPGDHSLDSPDAPTGHYVYKIYDAR